MKIEKQRTVSSSTVVTPNDDNVTTIGNTSFTVYLFGGTNVGQIFTVSNSNTIGTIRVQDESASTIDGFPYCDLEIGESLTVAKYSVSDWKIK
jgi:hypothetical protein